MADPLRLSKLILIGILPLTMGFVVLAIPAATNGSGRQRLRRPEWRQFNSPPTPSENGRVLLALT
jgi:hypothetical protein